MLWLVLLRIVLLAVLGCALVKLLLIVAASLALIWLIGFFASGAEGARWYRW